MTDKKTQRQICLTRRDRLSVKKRKEYSKAICRQLFPFLQGKRILSYDPTKSEADISMINEHFDVAYPAIKKGRQMDARHPLEKVFILNAFRIREPDPGYSEIIDPEDIDVVIVPCVGFDENKNRLGHGGGYYDRYLKKTHALKICVAFEAQKLNKVVSEEDDVRMDLIITEKSVY